MKRLTLVAVLCLASACAGEDTDVSEYAIDSDHSGAVDCHDLEHVQACVADTHHTGCEDADVNHDGSVDDGDIHDIDDGLAATGHHCTEPSPH